MAAATTAARGACSVQRAAGRWRPGRPVWTAAAAAAAAAAATATASERTAAPRDRYRSNVIYQFAYPQLNYAQPTAICRLSASFDRRPSTVA